MFYNNFAYNTQIVVLSKNVDLTIAMYIFFRLFEQIIEIVIEGVIFQNEFRTKFVEISSFVNNATQLTRDVNNLVQIIKVMSKNLSKRTFIITIYANNLKIL